MDKLDERIAEYDRHIAHMAKEDDRARQLMNLNGVGPITAIAIIAIIGNGNGVDFKCGRQFSAWVGLTPSQHSSGGKAKLGRITKAGNSYLRRMLVWGARLILLRAKGKNDAVSRWAVQLKERRGYWRAVVALAAKNARMCWAMLQRGSALKMPA